MSWQRRLPAIGLTLIFLLLSALVFLRAQLVENTVGTYIACNGCFHSAVVTADLVMFSLAAAILLAAGLLRPAWLGRVLQLALGMLILVFATDLAVLRWYNSRLFLSDFNLFVANRSAVWDQFLSGLGGWLPAVAVLAGIVLMFVALAAMPPARSRSQRLILVAVLAVSLTSGALLHTQPYVNEWAVDNVFAANLATSERTRYSDAGAASLLARTAPAHRLGSGLAAGSGAQANVIVVMLESWSAWHSALFGGYEDWTPHLDDAARQGLRFSNFHSIGFSTDKGLVGILAGQALWSPFLHWFETPPFHSMWGVERSLPRVFSRQGYYTAFLTTGPLDLYRKGDWLLDLGFDLAEGNENPFYAGMPRFAFGSASDGALYQRAREWLETAPRPYLLVLETVTSHQPYADPDSGERSLEKAMKYADRTFGDFFASLRDTGFFAGGVLLVVSDHRSMTPIPARELDLFGPNAHSQVPAFIVGEGFAAGQVDGAVYSQADLVPSFELWLSGSGLFNPLQSAMFGQSASGSGADSERPGCAFHSRGDRRGLVEVICNSGRGQVKLDGDRTRFVSSEGLDEQQQSEILVDLARLRLEGLRRHEAQEGRESGATEG